MDRALIVMAKEPMAGRTKTRLSPPLSGQEAADLYRCFLLDTLDLMQQVTSAQPIIAYAPDIAAPFFRHMAPPGFDFVPQVGADLGERLDNVLRHCLQAGYRQAVVTDSDSPTLRARKWTVSSAARPGLARPTTKGPTRSLSERGPPREVGAR